MDVVESDGTLTIEVVNINEPSPETCDPSEESGYSYKLVTFLKTSKPISVTLTNET